MPEHLIDLFSLDLCGLPKRELSVITVVILCVNPCSATLGKNPLTNRQFVSRMRLKMFYLKLAIARSKT
jgi:hypothetical protein